MENVFYLKPLFFFLHQWYFVRYHLFDLLSYTCLALYLINNPFRNVKRKMYFENQTTQAFLDDIERKNMAAQNKCRVCI